MCVCILLKILRVFEDHQVLHEDCGINVFSSVVKDLDKDLDFETREQC